MRKTKESDILVDENVCQGCGDNYNDDNDDTKDFWVGCDRPECGRWYHYWCANLREMPEESEPFVCPTCSLH